MGLLDLPPELVEKIFTALGFRDILRCKSVSRSLCDLINDCPRLQYQVDLAISGFDDSCLAPNLDTKQREDMLSTADRLWQGSLEITLVDTVQCASLEYWPSRDLVLMNSVTLDDTTAVEVLEENNVAFDVSLAPNVSSTWQILLPRTAGLIDCADRVQDLVVLRCRKHTPEESLSDHWYCLSLCTLSTGEFHTHTRKPHIEFKTSQRLAENPHSIRIHILDDLLSMNMLSATDIFTETVFFDWKKGSIKAVFHSPNSNMNTRVWGYSSVLLSGNCFLQPCFSRTDRKLAIEVYALQEDGVAHASDSADEQHGVSHVATFWLPGIVGPDARLLVNVAARQQMFPEDSHSGVLVTSPHARILCVQIAGPGLGPQQCAFFTPASQFLAEVDRFLSLNHEQRTGYPVQKAWSTWGNHSTRWLEKEGPQWHQRIPNNLTGSGSRYIFPTHMVDFSPIDVAREVHEHQQTDSSGATAFPSRLSGWTTHCHVVEKAGISGSSFFEDDIVSSLPYRDRALPELPAYTPGSVLTLIGDKIMSVEGGAPDIIRIYSHTTRDADATTP